MRSLFILLKRPYILLTAIVLLALVLRLYRITNPIADWHSFRQADTASVTREFVKHGIDVLHPTYQDLSDIQSGKENPKGYRMVEFPLLNAKTAWIIKTFGLQANQELVGRLISVAASLVTLLAIYGLGTMLSGKNVGLMSALLFAVLPYSVYYSRVILPEPAMLATAMVGLYFAARWVKHDRKIWNVFMAVVAFASAILMKPTAIFMLPVVLVFPFILGKKNRLRDAFILGVAAALSVVPTMLWREWITQFPEGIPASDWLFNKENIRFSGAFFHWIFEVRLGTLILGIGLVGLAVLGLLKKGKDQLAYALWGLSMFAYLAIFAGGNVQHDYYQVLLLPCVVLLVARGAQAILELPSIIIDATAKYMFLLGMLGFSLFVSWYQVRGYFNVNHWEIVEAGKAADRLLPADAKVIAPYMGDTALLYQTNRTGWPIGFYIDRKIEMGAQYYVTVNKDDEANELKKKYNIVDETDRYLILDLTTPLKK